MYTPGGASSSRATALKTSRIRQVAPRSNVPAPPLTTDRNSNAALSFLQEEPAGPNVLMPKEGAGKLKIKSATTPEAKSRVLARPLLNNPASAASNAGPASTIKLVTPRMTQSESVESMTSGWMTSGTVEQAEVFEETGETEAVLVTVR
jgi:centromeric protein E